MKRDPIAFLWDAKDALDFIERHTQTFDEARFLAEPVLQAAVERKFEIIGEALNQFSKHKPDIAGQIDELSGVVSFRNMLAHGYVNIDARRVWRIVVVSLPLLKASLQKLLADAPKP